MKKYNVSLKINEEMEIEADSDEEATERFWWKIRISKKWLSDVAPKEILVKEIKE